MSEGEILTPNEVQEDTGDSARNARNAIEDLERLLGMDTKLIKSNLDLMTIP